MRKRNFGFTMIEMIVVVAIVVTLAAMLFPVVIMTKAQAARAVCAANYRQAHLATMAYVADYDDRLMPTNHQPTAMNSRKDRTWVQLLLPYFKESFASFKCPSDFGKRPLPEATFDEDLVPGDTESRYYQASQRSNIGYNYLYLAPVVKVGDDWVPQPHAWAEVASPSTSLLFVDTVNEIVNGSPTGGGNYLAIPPCRYEVLDSGKVDTFFSSPAGVNQVLTQSAGWSPDASSPFVYGGAWPWHRGRMTVISLGGTARAMTPNQIAVGCEVKADWGGNIQDGINYLWRIQDH